MARRDPRPVRGAPLLVRMAGLPLDCVQVLSGRLHGALEEVNRAETLRGDARAALAETLHAAVPGAGPELRRLLLALKRDAHNGRALHRHAAHPLWETLRGLAGEPLDRVSSADAEAERQSARFAAAFAAELERQRQVLREPLSDPSFSRGLALASPGLWDALRAPAPGRRARKVEQSLLRYVTRAAVKVSPFSTFSPVALGALSDDPSLRGVRLAGGGWRERSLMRLKRYLPQRAADLLCGYPPFRAGLGVEINSSLTEVEPGRFTFLSPHHWKADPATGALRFHRDAFATVRLGGPVVARVLELARGGGSYAGLASELGSEGRAELDRLLELRVLQLRMPWAAHEGHLEKRMLEHLRTLLPEPALDPLVVLLERLVALEDGFATASEPARSVREIDGLVPEISAAAAALAGFAAPAAPLPSPFNLYEDVHLVPREGGPMRRRRGVAEVPRDAVAEVARHARLLVRLSALFDHRHDMLHTLADAAREQWPGAAEVGFTECVRELLPLWRGYLAFRVSHWQTAGTDIRSWNPRALPEVEALHGWRTEVCSRLRECVRQEENGDEAICPEALAELLASVPACYTAADERGAMLLMQPASTDGALWVLNRLKEGTGRYGSRYTPVMEEATREWYAAYMAARGTFRLEGEEAHLLDLMCAQGDTVNVHLPQTPAVLTLPGERAEVAEHRRVTLRELRLAFDGPGGIPRLRDRGGRRYIPANLGVAFEANMGMLFQCLCTFGPSELGVVQPDRHWTRRGELRVSGRMRMGSLVVNRRMWSVPAAALRQRLEGASDAHAFAAVNRLRAEWEVPERVFFHEVLPHPFFERMDKPQYLDFSSPLFLPILREALAGLESFTMTELLPTPEMCPADPSGSHRVVELLIDTLALRRPRTRAGQGRMGTVAEEAPCPQPE